MEKKRFNLINRIISLAVLAASAVVYLCTIEPTASFWDCGEFIASSYKLEVGHPPGNPMFQIIARFFTIFADKDSAAVAVNAMSGLCSALTIFFLYLTIVHFSRRLLEKTRGAKALTTGNCIAIFASGVVGAMAYCFSDTFWFSAVEGEVYAMSSLFTAVVFWAMLKWEEEADGKFANRWIVLIALLMGLSIGVHLLNLLTVPAMVFIYYFRKNGKITAKGVILMFLLSLVILGAVVFLFIPYLPKITAYVDLFFVNVLGCPYNTGAVIFLLLLFAGCFRWIFVSARKGKVVSNTIALCSTMLMVGYSIFAVCVIRSVANTPTNEYQPDNPFTLVRYLGREQYGSNPILFGQTYMSDYDLESTSYYTPLQQEKTAKDGKTVTRGVYYKAPGPEKVLYKGKMLFPRMWSASSQDHKDFYDMYTEGNFRTRVEGVGDKATVIKTPRMVDNLRFFFDYQVNWMYMRYFMWNFVGRQNDFHGASQNLTKGNWESGIGFIDRARLGDQRDAPDYLLNNKGKNHYFFLPLLLGLLGLCFQVNKDGRNSWITFLLFLLTGLAIVVYLNQPPLQVRERDYAYAGSFYVFAIWIGLGVIAVEQWLSKLFKKQDGMATAIISTAVCLFIPAIMGAENWDDHDRSGRYTARDMAYNYLNSCDENALLVTHGDNDTFPLWYIQEVEGVRTDIRVVNTSLLGTDWYIDQLRRRTYESDPLPISLDRKSYLYGTNDWVPVRDMVDGAAIKLSDAMTVVRDQRPQCKIQWGDGPARDFFPARKLIIPVNRENVIKYGIVPPEDYDRIEDYVMLEIPEAKNYISKTDLIMLDILSNYQWDRPLCVLSLGGDITPSLRDYLQYEGFCHKFVPIKSSTGIITATQVNRNDLYERLMSGYRLDNFADRDVYWDYQNLYTFLGVSNIRTIYYMAAMDWYRKGNLSKVRSLLDRCFEVMPDETFPYNVSALGSANEVIMVYLIDLYFKVGEREKAYTILNSMVDQTLGAMSFFSTPCTHTADGFLDLNQFRSNLDVVDLLADMLRDNGEKEMADKLGAILKKN